jgi:hypothetical protein
MGNTILDQPSFERARDRIAQPYVQTIDSLSRESSLVIFHDDNAALAVGGGFSCVEDMTKLLQHILEPVINGDEKAIEIFLTGKPALRVAEDTKFASFSSGIYAPLDSELTGSESFERFPQSSVFNLGQHEGESISAISKAGAVRGFACHFYMIPYQRLVMAVMTNVSGIADPSHLLAQYLIEEILDLKPSISQLSLKASNKLADNRAFLKENAVCYRPHLGFTLAERENLRGHYVEATTRQRIVVDDKANGSMSAYIEEGYGQSRRRTSNMTLIKIAPNTIAFSPAPEELAIDAHHAWRTFALSIKVRGNGEVDALVRDESYRDLNGFEEPASFGSFKKE